MFRKENLQQPSVIDFTRRVLSKGKPYIYRDDEQLSISAAHEPELRRLVGHFATRQSWSAHDWLLGVHTKLYILGGLLLVAVLPVTGYFLAHFLQDYVFSIIVLTSIIDGVIALWISYQIAMKSAGLLNEFTIQMQELGCLSEYDGNDYVPDFHAIAVGTTLVSLGAAILLMMLGAEFDLAFTISIPVFLILGFCSITLLFKSIDRSFPDLCFRDLDYDADDYEAVIPYEDSEYLQTAFLDVIERLDLQGVLQSKYESEFNEIKARFHRVKYPQCRSFYDYVEDGILYLDTEDLSEQAARRYGATHLAARGLRFYSELSLRQRAVELIAFFFGLCMLPVVMLGTYLISPVFAIGATIVTSIIFLRLWYKGWKQNEELRHDLPIQLQKTGIFNEYQLKHYYKVRCTLSSRFDLTFLVVFHIILVGILLLSITLY
ncbi:MAG: hypothetical protein JW779_05705 [Candidatus Thorarchaeota archaeon]|nr:hypothetical protein [Candidatus Thorarchaeota archaeon]